MQGVPTGILADIPMSGVWRPVEPDERPNLELLLHAEPWGSALDDPDCLLELVEADVQAGFASGGLPEAKERYGDLCAAGRLGLVKKEGSQPRLIGDSSISNANQLSRICEKVELPSLEDVAQFVSRHQDTEWHAFSLDIAKAHKRIRVCHAERGLSLVAVVDSSGATRWLVYNTTHFGCAWAAYWWARTAAAFVRALHCFLQGNHFAAMYVDDLLALFPRQAASLMACLCVTLACGLALPLSWHKLQLSSCIKWIGWNFRLNGLPRAFLPPDKQEVLLAALAPLCRPGTWLRRTDLRRLIGRLCWFTAGARWLKPFMCSWFRCLMKPQVVLQSLDAGQREELHRCLGAALVVREQCSLSDVQRGWILMEVGAQKVSSADALLCAVSKNGRAWCKLGDPDSRCIKITKAEAQLAKFFRAVIAAEVPSALSVIMETGCCSSSRCLCRWCQSRPGRLVAAFKFTTLPWKHLLFFHTATTFWFTCLVFVWREGGFTEVYLRVRSAGPACPARISVAIRWAGRSWLDCSETVVWQHGGCGGLRQSIVDEKPTHWSLAVIRVICGKAPGAAAYFSRCGNKKWSCPSFWSKLEPSQRCRPEWEQLLCLCHSISWAPRVWNRRAVELACSLAGPCAG